MAGFVLKDDEQGVAIMNNMAEGIDTSADDIVTQTEALLDSVDQYPALGPHKDSIKRIVSLIQEETKSTSAPARVVANKLREKAKEYQEWIDDDLFGGSGN